MEQRPACPARRAGACAPPPAHARRQSPPPPPQKKRPNPSRLPPFRQPAGPRRGAGASCASPKRPRPAHALPSLWRAPTPAPPPRTRGEKNNTTARWQRRGIKPPLPHASISTRPRPAARPPRPGTAARPPRPRAAAPARRRPGAAPHKHPPGLAARRGAADARLGAAGARPQAARPPCTPPAPPARAPSINALQPLVGHPLPPRPNYYPCPFPAAGLLLALLWPKRPLWAPPPPSGPLNPAPL
jgi:translation initiation factor IF-2